MIRLYLDWNVFSYLNNLREAKEPYISLNRILTNNKDRILIPYSSAHLTDLIPAYKKSEASKEKTETNLSYLAELTNHRCIIYDANKKTTYPDKHDINQYFPQLLDSDQMLSGDSFESLFSSIEDPEMQAMIKPFFDILKNLPVNISELIPAQSVEFPTLNNHFGAMFSGNSFYDLLNNTYKMMSDYNADPTKYRSIRNMSLDELKLSHDYTQAENPIEAISKNMELSAFKKSFKEFADQNLKNYFKDKEPSRFDIFTNYYMQLDFLGYYRDRVFKNMLQDSFHAYYGAHCDFFVTDDDNTYHKAKVIYDYFNIETVVCKTNEFIGKFFGKVILNSKMERSLLEVISDILSNSFVLPNQYDEKFNPVNIYKPDHYILNYFNRLQLTDNIDGTKDLYLYKNSKNYSDFYFFKEVESTTNNLFKEFGPSLNSRTTYIPETETRELAENNWAGRIWKLDNATLELQMMENPFGLTLSIHLPGK